MSSPLHRAAIAAGLFLFACSSSSDDSGPPPPTPESLFQGLPAATPDKLRGVWQTTQDASGGTVELRLRFVEKYLVGAAQCTTTDKSVSVIAGASIGLDASGLDAATGKVTFGALTLHKQENGLDCQAALPGNTYDFKIDGGTLSLSVGDAKLNTTFTKVGD